MSEDRHTWFHKKILEKFKSYQDFAKAVHYEPATVYLYVVAQRPPSDGLAEKMAEMFNMKAEEAKDYMLDDYDKNRKHRAETGDHYFTAKLTDEKLILVKAGDNEYQYDQENKLVKKTKKQPPKTSVQKYIDEINQADLFLNEIFSPEILVNMKEIESYQKGVRKGLKIAVEILSRGK